MTDAYWTEHGTRGASLSEFAPTVEEQEPHHKVGRWFEQVHLAALQSTPGVEVLVANEQLRGGGRTIGELDVLYRQDARVVHREIAVKYYLAAKPGRDPALWYGPGKRDRMDIKLERLATHQSRVATKARDADAWPEALPFPDDTEVLLLGALFSPPDDPRLPDGANPDAAHGRWYYASDFAARFGDAPWSELNKPWWLSPEHAREGPKVAAAELAKDLSRPLFVGSASAVVVRAFVVPDGWWADV